MSNSWGPLGTPPQEILDGTSNKMKLFKFYHDEMAKALKIASSKKRAVRVAEIKAQYNRDFPK